VPVRADFHRFWSRLDAIVADVRPTPWGAVVTRPDAPDVWDVNYARVDAHDPVSLDDVEASLLPALRAADVGVEHVVSFDPESHGALFEAIVAKGHRVSWDALLVLEGRPPPVEDHRVEELVDAGELDGVVRAVLREWFEVEPDAAIGQLVRLDRDVLRAAGKRWFGIRDGGRVVSAGTLLELDGLAYVDDVATLPASRGRGHASAVVTRIAEEARRAGAGEVMLLADPGAARVIAMYERLGFREAGRLVSSRGPTPAA